MMPALDAAWLAAKLVNFALTPYRSTFLKAFT